MTYMEKRSSYSIGNTSHNPLKERTGEVDMGKDQMEVGPTREIKCFGQINLEYGEFKAIELHRVKGFLCNANGLMDLSIVKEGKFFLRYVPG